MKVYVESNHYKLVPHWSVKTDAFHYHLVLNKEQKSEVNGRDIFRNSTEIQNAGLNEELTELLMYGIADGAGWIKVEILPDTDNSTKISEVEE